MVVFIDYVAAVIDVGQFTPQLWRVIRHRDDDRAMTGISVIAYVIATSQAILWTIYGFATDRLPIGLPNVFIAPACAAGRSRVAFSVSQGAAVHARLVTVDAQDCSVASVSVLRSRRTTPVHLTILSTNLSAQLKDT